MSESISNGIRPATSRMPWARPLAVTMWTIFLVGATGTVVARGANGTLGENPLGQAALLVAFGAFATVGAIVASRRPDNAIGWIFGTVGVLAGLGGFAEEYSRHALNAPAGILPFGVLAAWIQGWYWGPLIGLVVIFTPLLFPTGHLPSRRWRPLSCLAVGSIGAFSALAALQDRLVLDEGGAVVRNPVGVAGVPNPEQGVAGTVLEVLAVASLVGVFASVVARFRRSVGDERQQLKWFMYAAALIPVQLITDQLIPDRFLSTDILFGVGVAALPVAAGVAILKYRLYDIDFVINRTLVYGALTAGVIGFYIGVVTAFDAFLQRTGVGVSLIATALVAVFFQPARERLQSGVHRLMYGEDRDPYKVLSRLGKRLESLPAIEQILPSLTETIAEALRLPYVAVELKQGGDLVRVAAHGDAPGDTLDLPLLYQGRALGSLVVGQRAPGEEFSAADLHLLEDLARQTGAAAHAVRLTAELQTARQRLVTALEEERRRLRRDLHDGLGPTLAGVGLEIEAARNLMSQDVGAADRALGGLSSKIEEAISDIRRLVYGLRPPALDELGLVGALQEHARRYAAAEEGPMISIDAVGDLSSLPAAVEVAAYHITLEALTNAARHSRATRCSARLELRDAFLNVQVVDDGKGLRSDHRVGVGLSSMRERAAELGGTCTIESTSGGTQVRARLPCPRSL
ncbi:MAG: histidine kinase [Actinomycetota bacterium]